MTSVPPEPPVGSGPPPPVPPQPSPSVPPVPPEQPTQQWSAPPASPPAQQWSAPPGQPAPAGLRGFEPASIKPMDWGILAAGILAFIFSFVTYYSYSLGPLSRDFNAWDGFFGWFSTLLALFSAALLAVHLFAPQVQLPTVRSVVLSGFVLAALSVITAGFVDSRDISGTGIDSSRGAGYYLSLIVILAGAALSYLRLRETRGTLPWERSRA
jgi:hypothetical protein